MMNFLMSMGVGGFAEDSQKPFKVHPHANDAFKLVRRVQTQPRFRVLSICQISPKEIFIDMFRYGRIVPIDDISQTLFQINSGEAFRYVTKVTH